ncbi:MAG TPA: hypothetical protein VGF28_16920 [Thermoanaerobaculia bacterium]
MHRTRHRVAIVSTRTDGSGHVTRYTYDFLGNILSRTEASGTPKARTTSYVYAYPSWRTFATSIIEPSVVKQGLTKTTTFSWSAGETVLTRAETGWVSSSDAAPTTFTSTTTFDARHRTVSSNGPRTESRVWNNQETELLLRQAA